jgi:hypothetical protein
MFLLGMEQATTTTTVEVAVLPCCGVAQADETHSHVAGNRRSGLSRINRQEIDGIKRRHLPAWYRQREL